MRETVVIGFAESLSSPEVVWSLAGSEFRVIAFARVGSRAALRSSRYATIFDVTPPEQDVAATIQELTLELERLLHSYNSRVVLLALDDAAVWVFARIAPSERVSIVSSGGHRSEFALNKELQIAAASKAGLRVPKTVALSDKRDLTDLCLQFPVILKPGRAISFRNGILAKGRFHLCFSRSELDRAIRESSPDEHLLVQQHISGVGEGLFGLATRNGVVAWSAHRRIRMMNPLGSGASACISVKANANETAVGARFIGCLEWRGPFMIELLRDDDGQAWFMEFNGRLWGSLALARRSGLEYPAWAALETLGLEGAIPANPRSRPGVVCRHAGRELLHALFVLKGRRSSVPNRWPSKWQTLKQLARFRSSEYWYNWRRNDWRVFVNDFLVTVAEVVFTKSYLRQR